MAKTDFKNIDQYHEQFPEAIVQRMEHIRSMIHDMVPEVEECISYQIPCFKYKGYLLYYSAYKQHISISYPYTNAFILYFKNELKNYKVSKSAIQIPHHIELPISFITSIIKFRLNENIESLKFLQNKNKS